jgi:coenzyme F420-0:L-glutamate ligase
MFFYVCPGHQLLDVAGPMAVIEAANRLSREDRYQLAILSNAGGLVRSSSHMWIETDSAAGAWADTLIVVGGEIEQLVLANAGVDQSNVAAPDGGEFALLLPLDPDGSARRLRAALAERAGVAVGVVISDSFGRAWRIGTVGVAIGAAGLSSVLDLRGQPDLFGRQLKVTVVGHADEIAAAASLVMGQGAEACPLVLVRGLAGAGLVGGGDIPAAALLRPPEEDLFR